MIEASVAPAGQATPDWNPPKISPKPSCAGASGLALLRSAGSEGSAIVSEVSGTDPALPPVRVTVPLVRSFAPKATVDIRSGVIVLPAETALVAAVTL